MINKATWEDQLFDRCLTLRDGEERPSRRWGYNVSGIAETIYLGNWQHEWAVDVTINNQSVARAVWRRGCVLLYMFESCTSRVMMQFTEAANVITRCLCQYERKAGNARSYIHI